MRFSRTVMSWLLPAEILRPRCRASRGLGIVMCLQAIRVSMETDLSAETIARKAMAIAAGIRVYELQLNG